MSVHLFYIQCFMFPTSPIVKSGSNRETLCVIVLEGRGRKNVVRERGPYTHFRPAHFEATLLSLSLSLSYLLSVPIFLSVTQCFGPLLHFSFSSRLRRSSFTRGESFEGRGRERRTRGKREFRFRIRFPVSSLRFPRGKDIKFAQTLEKEGGEEEDLLRIGIFVFTDLYPRTEGPGTKKGKEKTGFANLKDMHFTHCKLKAESLTRRTTISGLIYSKLAFNYFGVKHFYGKILSVYGHCQFQPIGLRKKSIFFTFRSKAT